MFNRLCSIGIFLALCCITGRVSAQNWLLTVQDPTQGTPIYQVNGVAGGMAVLYGALDNFTGMNISDDGTGNPALPTILDFGGFGFTQYPGQFDLASLFMPDPRSPGYPQVPGSSDGVNPGSIGFVSLGSFDLSSIAPGIYQEDFTATAFPDDFNSTVPFGDITGTLTLRVTAANTPEPSSAITYTIFCVMILCRRRLTRRN